MPRRCWTRSRGRWADMRRAMEDREMNHVAMAQMTTTGGELPAYRLRRVAQYIHDNLQRELRLADLGALVHMSPYHFARLFKRSTGVPPHRFQVLRRIDQARALLAARTSSIAAISRLVGFRTPSHFTTTFRRITGMTPSAYRGSGATPPGGDRGVKVTRCRLPARLRPLKVSVTPSPNINRWRTAPLDEAIGFRPCIARESVRCGVERSERGGSRPRSQPVRPPGRACDPRAREAASPLRPGHRSETNVGSAWYRAGTHVPGCPEKDRK